MAVRYSHHRFIAGRPDPTPIASHRTHSARLIAGLAQTYAMNFLHRQTLHRFATGASGDDGNQIEQAIALTKTWVSWSAQRIASEARERCGAQGMFQVNGVGGQAAALDSVITAEGDNLPIVIKVAAETLFRERPTPAAADVHDLRKASLNDLRQLLSTAETLVARRARDRFRAAAGSERGLARWNQAALPAVEAAMIHAVGQAADAFLAAVERCPDHLAQTMLAELCHLFIITELQPHAAALLADGYLSADAVRSLPDAVEERIVALTPHMLTLVAAFRLDDYLAGIPIANPNYPDAFDDDGAHWNRGSAAGSAFGRPQWDLAFPPHPTRTGNPWPTTRPDEPPELHSPYPFEEGH
ncbi:acyl-CoA dehydrogenase [Streptomyces lydicus]|uniref:acyl-CoA dehydrogenase n=1 Tax=Streptomyces lydicus TaxID=47763 RepID=UPI0036E94EDC